MIITAIISGRALPSLSRILHRAFATIYRMKFFQLPPFKISGAAGISGLTGIVGTFFFKDYLDLPAEFLAMLGFGVGLSKKMTTPNHLTSVGFIHSDLSPFQENRERGAGQGGEQPPPRATPLNGMERSSCCCV